MTGRSASYCNYERLPKKLQHVLRPVAQTAQPRLPTLTTNTIHCGDARVLVPAVAPNSIALSGRNRLRGFVEEVRVDGLLGQVRLRIGDQTLTAVITADALTELKLKRGDDAVAIVKSTEVMIAREAAAPVRQARSRRSRR